MNAVGAALLVGTALAVFGLPRKWALLALVTGALYLPLGLHIELGFNLFALRILGAVGFARVVSRRELSFTSLNSIDKVLLTFTFYTTIVFLFRSPDGQAFEIGRTVDTCFAYFTFRALVRDLEEFKAFLRLFVVPLIPYMGLVVLETITLENPFNTFLAGTAPYVVREGGVRAVGSFLHPSLLGTLGGRFLPLYVSLWLTKTNRVTALCGVVLSVMLVLASNSGAPLACVMVGAIGWACWPFRRRMKLVRYALVGLIVSLALAMKAPIWYLLARFSELTGGDGYHRSYLLDISFQNLDKWWLAGMAIADTRDWFPYINYTTGGADMTNQFLVWGMTAGLGAMVLWVVLLKRAFSRLGTAMTVLRHRHETHVDQEYFLWGLGVLLAVHVMNWMSIPYFDQSAAFFFLELAVIANLTQDILKSVATEPQRVQAVSQREVGGKAVLGSPAAPRLRHQFTLDRTNRHPLHR